jgi:hypothetical protein
MPAESAAVSRRRSPIGTSKYRVSCAWAAGLALSLCAACGGSYPESEYPSKPPHGVTPPEDDQAPAPPGSLWRRDVNAALDGGLGLFLQHADLAPEVQEGTFVGFKIVELRPPGWWQGIDLSPGDVIVQVNGMPIEQPTEAHDAFESLRKSDKLTVHYLRGGEARDLVYTIIDKPGAAASGASASKAPALGSEAAPIPAAAPANKIPAATRAPATPAPAR